MSTQMSSMTIQDMTPEQELAQLPPLIQTWKQIRIELQTLEDQRREKKSRLKAYEDLIMRLMKKHEIGALDLKSSGGRLVYQTRESKAGLSQGSLMQLLTEQMKSEERAKEALQYISEHRSTKTIEKLKYEAK